MFTRNLVCVKCFVLLSNFERETRLVFYFEDILCIVLCRVLNNVYCTSLSLYVLVLVLKVLERHVVLVIIIVS